MKIVIMTSGSRGDVQPYLALGRGLQAAGHEVTVATHRPFKEFVEGTGLIFKPVAGDPQELLASELGQQWLKTGRNSFAFLVNFVRLTRPHFRSQLRDFERAAEAADLILFSPFAGGGLDIAENMGVPVALVALQPFHATREFPAMGAFDAFELSFMNRASHRFAHYLMWLPFRDIHNRWRQQDLGMSAHGLQSPMSRMQERQIPTLYGFSPSVIPPPLDWAPWVHVTGYWFLDQRAAWRPPEALHRFITAGEPPIYLGFGSMIRQAGDSLLGIAQEVAGKLGRRIVLQRSWQGDEVVRLSPEVFVIDEVAHSWLFPRMTAVVHHGGAGTTAAGLRAGVPNLLVPHFADQFFWAKWVEKHEAGPPPIPQKDLGPDRLVKGLRQAMGDQRMRSQAAALGANIRKERGVPEAVRVIESFI